LSLLIDDNSNYLHHLDPGELCWKMELVNFFWKLC